jgi:hypothetical protein
MATRKSAPKTEVAESSPYMMTGDIVTGVERLEALAKNTIKAKAQRKIYPLRLKVSFRAERDCRRFASLIQRNIKSSEKEIAFSRPRNSTVRSFTFTVNTKKKERRIGLSEFHAEHWKCMPDFEQEKSVWTYHSLTMIFKSARDYAEFAVLVRQHLTEEKKSIYFPEWTPEKVRFKKWVSTLPRQQITPQYPIYIISKGRAHSRLTSKTLEAMQVPYFIVVEPAEYESYAAVIDPKKILILPYNSDPTNPTGPGRARNWCRDHSWSKGLLRHWVLDDNIDGFFRLHNNKRYRVADGAIFRAAEDFVDRYENVWVAGFQYRFFCAPKSKHPPFVANTRIYSCLLIDNRLILELDGQEFLWRERYNEDTILSLDVLENGYCTIQFNTFLQGKMGTQTLKGGNTELFYAPEGDAALKASKTKNYNPGGTVRKTLNLIDLYPDVAKAVIKFGRVHHEVNYSKYKSNQLLRRDDCGRLDGINNYGMELVKMTAAEAKSEAAGHKKSFDA